MYQVQLQTSGGGMTAASGVLEGGHVAALRAAQVVVAVLFLCLHELRVQCVPRRQLSPDCSST